ncbi:EF-hand domain-containing protein [Haematococcus lacustris]|uniref:EF-hand domain-containing protein n=1 Tax=Haematococcus lacustris TaxID=44745 RepID=A0A699ZH79_HAELA|nr:EF-hand domain-containing protein [Haematococcus lacustris]
MSGDSELDAYATNILQEKRARKVAEDDALKLYNRVRALQKEEDKAHKRIQDTKRKAKEIIKLRERNELVRQEKELRMRELQLEVERQKQENLRLKEDIVRNKTEQENKIWADKVTLAQQAKEERAEFERLLAESKLLSRKEALEQKDAIRKQQEEARRKMEMLKMGRLQQVSAPATLGCAGGSTWAQGEYERRLREEMEAKSAKEAEIERLAEIEAQLIGRLKHKQTEQRRAYQQLEAVLSLGGNPSSSRTPSKPHSPALSQSASPFNGGGGSLTDEATAPTAPAGEPSEEDVARAFSMYDEEAIGEIPAACLGGVRGQAAHGLDKARPGLQGALGGPSVTRGLGWMPGTVESKPCWGLMEQAGQRFQVGRGEEGAGSAASACRLC